MGIVLASFGLMQYAGWLPSNQSRFAVTGRFDNPAGFAATLVMILPVGLFLLLSEKKSSNLHWFSAIGLLVLLSAIILSGSRTGILAAIASSGLLLIFRSRLFELFKHHISNWNIYIPVVVFIILVGSASALYTLDINSANGRLLIWRVSAHMIAENPLLGHGSGSFQAEYMKYQANYFTHHPDSNFGQLADNVKHPLNEYVLILVEYGTVGLMMLFLFIYSLFKEVSNINSDQSLLCLSGLAGLLIFSFFSYPLQYVSVWILGIFYFSIGLGTRWVSLQRGMRVILSRIGVVVVILICLYITIDKIKTNIKWNNVAQNALGEDTIQMLPKYEKLYPKLKNNPFFLYNYGAELSVAGKYDKSIEILRECQLQFNDYDLQLLLAKNYEAKGNLKKATAIYKRASNMIPVRFWPLYKLVKIYRERCEINKAIHLAKRILKKRVKIPSSIISSVKYQMRKFLDDENVNNCR